jgi:hypothetical protein
VYDTANISEKVSDILNSQSDFIFIARLEKHGYRSSKADKQSSYLELDSENVILDRLPPREVLLCVDTHN